MIITKENLRPAGAAAVLTVAAEVLAFIHKRQLLIVLQICPLVVK